MGRAMPQVFGQTGQRTLKVILTFLEMTAPPRRASRPAPLKKLAVLRAEKPTLSFYRYLYETVGAPWQWTDRRLMSDDELQAIVHDDSVEIYVLYVAGVPAGFVELDFRTMAEVEIVLLGLVPEFTGQGLSGFLLNWAVDTAWRQETALLKVTTNTLDHPRALGMNQKVGFDVAGRAESYLVPLSAIEAGTLAAPEQDA